MESFLLSFFFYYCFCSVAQQTSLSFTVSCSLLKLMSIESVMPSNHLILCRPLLLLPSIFPSTRVLSSELALLIRWPKFQSFSFSPSNEYSGLISFRIRSPCSPRDSQESSLAPWLKSINPLVLSLLYGPTFTFIHDYWRNLWLAFFFFSLSLDNIFNLVTQVMISQDFPVLFI